MNSPLISHRSREASAALPKIERFFQMASAQLRARLVSRSAADVPVRVSGVEVRTLEALAGEEELAGGVVVGELSLGAGRAPGVVLMQHNLLTRLIAVLLGEDLDSGSALSAFRALSPVERRIAGRIFEDLAGGLSDCWPEPGMPPLTFTGLATAATLRDSRRARAPVFTAMLDFGDAGCALGLMAVALPVEAFSIEEAPQPGTKRRRREGSLATVMNVELEAVVELTRLSLTVSALRQLEVGEVLPLGSMRDALIKINDKPLFEGEAGVSNGVRSVRLKRRADG